MGCDPEGRDGAGDKVHLRPATWFFLEQNPNDKDKGLGFIGITGNNKATDRPENSSSPRERNSILPATANSAAKGPRSGRHSAARRLAQRDWDGPRVWDLVGFCLSI